MKKSVKRSQKVWKRCAKVLKGANVHRCKDAKTQRRKGAKCKGAEV